jgi:DNA-directed RNA polymerase subunit K/omega
MIMVAAARAREIERKHTIAEKDSGRIIRTAYKPINAALKEIIDGELTPQGTE